MQKLGISVAVVLGIVLSALCVGACLGSLSATEVGLSWSSGEHLVHLGRLGVVHSRITLDICGPNIDVLFQASLATVSASAAALVGGVYMLLLACDFAAKLKRTEE